MGASEDQWKSKVARTGTAIELYIRNRPESLLRFRPCWPFNVPVCHPAPWNRNLYAQAFLDFVD